MLVKYKQLLLLECLKEEQRQEEEFKKLDLYQEKDCVMAQLLHSKNASKVDDEMEEERQRRMSITAELTDDEKVGHTNHTYSM